MDAWLTRKYERLGPRYTDWLFGLTGLAVVLFTPIYAAEAVGYLRVDGGEYAELVVVGWTCEFLAWAILWVLMRRAAAPIRRFSAAGDAQTGERAWQALTTELPRRWLWVALLIVAAATPPTIIAIGFANISYAWLPVVFITLAVMIAGGWLLVYLAWDAAMAPIVRAIDAVVPDRLAPAHFTSTLSFKLLAVPSVIALHASVVAAGVVRDSFGVVGRVAAGFGSALLIALTLSFAATLLLRRSILGPTGELLAATDRVRDGDLDTRVPLTTEGELGVLERRFNEMLAGLRERESLRDENTGLVDELRESRTRIVAAADESRRKVERDLHDGAQQNLVLLHLKLGLVEKQLDDEPAAEAVAEARADLLKALADLRDLAHGIYPQVLTADGLRAALAQAAEQCAIPTTFSCHGAGRYTPELEAAVYFCCLEALQNAAKYAGESANVGITLADFGRELRFEVADDGVGFEQASAAGSAGLQNMADRIGSLGGEFRVDSKAGGGTRVTGVVPLEA